MVVGAQVLRHPALPSNGTVEHPTEGDTIDGSRMDAETNNPARILIHDDQDPMGPGRGTGAMLLSGQKRSRGSAALAAESCCALDFSKPRRTVPWSPRSLKEFLAYTTTPKGWPLLL